MEVKMYVYKSPYPSPFQIGREDTTQKQTKDTNEQILNTQKNIQTTKEIENISNNSVNKNRLDIYV